MRPPLKALLAALGIVGIVLALTAVLSLPRRPKPEAARVPAEAPPSARRLDPAAATAEVVVEPASGTPSVVHEEVRIVEPVPYFPPPTVNLSGAKLGNQRVPGVSGAGDIHQLYFHTPSLTLFMAAIEPDGLRSIWKLTERGKAERVFAAGIGKGEISVFGDSRGRIYVQHDNPSRLYRSEDGLKTWRLVLKDYGSFWQMADDGNGTVYGAVHDWNRAILYRSSDDGFSWEPWLNFQELFPEYADRYDPSDDRYRLRHLHGVVYDRNKDQLIVGAGDVARFTFMSSDGGKTWRKIWDEGFTAAAQMSGGFRWLLGPDQLHGHGIALYDAEKETVREVWNPIPYNYAGYSYSLLNVNGIYYAAFHTEANEVETVVPKFGVIVSPDGEKWYRFLEWGPLGNHARTTVWLASAPTIVYASINGALYAFRPLEPSWFADQQPFK